MTPYVGVAAMQLAEDYLPARPTILPWTDSEPWRPTLPEWWSQAACEGADASLFFPERGADVNAAKAICAGCPVRDLCLEWALDHGEKFGIWGGTSERERRTIRRTRPRRAITAAECPDCGRQVGSGAALATHRRFTHPEAT